VVFSKKDIQDNINHLGFIMVWFSTNKQDENKIGYSSPLLEYVNNPSKEFCNTLWYWYFRRISGGYSREMMEVGFSGLFFYHLPTTTQVNIQKIVPVMIVW